MSDIASPLSSTTTRICTPTTTIADVSHDSDSLLVQAVSEYDDEVVWSIREDDSDEELRKALNASLKLSYQPT